MKKFVNLFFLLVLIPLYCQNVVEPPVAKIIPYESNYHREKLTDNYAWLKDKTRENEEVLQYIRAENNYTNQMMKQTQGLQKKLFKEVIKRVEEKDESLPVKNGDYYYYWKRGKRQQYSDYFRKKGSLAAKEELLLSLNGLAKRYSYVDVIGISVSPDHHYLAYLIDTNGSEEYTLQIKDLQTKTYLPENSKQVGDITWANDNQTIFFTKEDSSGRSFQVYRHKLGNDINKAELVFEEQDGKFYVWTSRSRSARYLFLGTASKTTSEIWYLDADMPDAEFRLIEPRRQGTEYYFSHANDTFYITTNSGDAFNYKIMKTRIEQPEQKYWQEFIPHRDSVTVNIDVFQNYIAVYERIKGNVQLRIMDHKKEMNQIISFPEKTYSLYFQANTEYTPTIYRFAFESYITPYTVYELDLHDFSMTIAKEQKIRGNYNKNEYQTELLYATAGDGTEIPISLVYKKDLRRNIPSPLLLYAYGSYGDTNDPYFSASRLSLLDRGIIFATAHVRGGGELGRKWYEDGKLMHKKNTFTDFIDCAEFLISQNYTNSKNLIIQGGSAGGLLIGAVINMRPDLFLAAIADVPFVDVLNTMFDPSLSAVESEYEEWGNPNDKVYFDYIRSYCPYQNTTRQDYPHLLILAGFNDPRVNYWESLKWTAKLRAIKTDKNLLLLNMTMNAGHGGSSGRFDYFKEIAFENAFILKLLGKRNE
jgi:oligopeptidase B